jgi:hypothetical protein
VAASTVAKSNCKDPTVVAFNSISRIYKIKCMRSNYLFCTIFFLHSIVLFFGSPTKEVVDHNEEHRRDRNQSNNRNNCEQ